VDKETGRMKIETAASYITTAYTMMIVIYVTFGIAIFVGFFTPYITKQLGYWEFTSATLILEIVVIIGIITQARKFNRRII